jgi:two-component system sensor histidine kinase RegB
MFSTSLVAKHLVPGLALRPLLVAIAAVVATNLVWMVLVPRTRARLVVPQAVSDLLLLGVILWFSGGAANPFAVFLAFQVALVGALADAKSTAWITLVALGVAAVLFLAPPLPLQTAIGSVGLVMHAGHLAALAGLTAFVGVSAFIYRARLDHLLRERDRSEHMAMLGRMAGGMAHELNTPLATILLASQELVALGPDDAEDFATLSRTLAREARRASDLIESLRGRVRADAGIECLEIGPIVAGAANAELARLHYGGRATVAVQSATRAWVFPSALERILENLVANAVHASKEVPSAHVLVEAASKGGDRVEIRVTDNGPGVAPELARRIGEPFVTTKSASGGTGLGLYVCSMLAKRMGAELRIESEEGKGTSVVLGLHGSRARSGDWSPEP